MWYYNNNPFNPDEELLKQYHGFVYQITELDTNMKYIGKKFFWSTRKLPPLKGKSRKRIKIIESDWKDYYGSNEELKLLVEKKSPDNYNREILVLCKTKGDCSYWEAKFQFENNVLLRDDYYNQFIGCKIHSRHLSSLRELQEKPMKKVFL